MKKTILSMLAATALVSTPALAQNVEFTLINESGYTLTYFYASPSNDENWGEDLLAEIGVLESGYNGTVFIGDGSDQCLYDFRFETAEGPELEEFEIDICELASYTLVPQ
ncbi:hypothetical protein OF122_11895 [Pelagibacterium flavum]|uniref:Argininosuccinate lyase n=1 Tax=Pelagibacterium flavum TaxID=2984530 RepID=A0ABY6IJM3_9HYPH|nr:hypothetical protein [Pelagibacterium sp. YIM 151497]MAN77035.1 hypothetical protein [Hyphomicrobiales bacterium]UYQ70768.1 hypothetical protein OF122_11895 [Pelagibacterium sp. YIM 151497]